jgi:uncharacterized protein (DUF1778 family)
LIRTALCRTPQIMPQASKRRVQSKARIRSARLEARLPPQVHAAIKRAATLQGRSVTDFVVAAAHDAAHRAIAETEMIGLSLEDQRRFAEALLSPPKPSAALRRAFKRHNALVSGG